MQLRPVCPSASRPRGAVAVQVLITLVLLLGVAALAIDVGNLYAAKAELQNAADAAALAGASAFADDVLRQQMEDDDDFDVLTDAARNRATAYANKNETTRRDTNLEFEDILVGTYDPANPTAPLSSIGQPNAVAVTARFTEDSSNGPISNFFASVFGYSHTDVTAAAAAAFDDHFASYTPTSPGPLIPFTIYVDTYLEQFASGADDFSYDPDLDLVLPFGDGMSEVVLYPYKDDPGGDGAGNFGLLNVGNPSQGVPWLRQQIENGITPEDLVAEIGTSELTFVDADGNSITYDITGNPGMKTSLESSVETRIGDVVGFFVHNALVGTGANAVYTIVYIRFGRVMEVHMTGKQSQRRIRVQPAVWTDPGVQTDPDAPSSGGMVGRIVLIQ